MGTCPTLMLRRIRKPTLTSTCKNILKNNSQGMVVSDQMRKELGFEKGDVLVLELKKALYGLN